MGAVDHIVRRSLGHPSAMNLFKRTMVEDGPDKIEIPKGAAITLAAVLLSFCLFMSLLEYSLRDVVATLAMVETPSAAITVSPSTEEAPKDVKEGLLEAGPTITLVHQKPLTSSIRRTLRHLISQAGWTARFRGLLGFIFYHFCFATATNMLDAIIPGRYHGFNILRVILISAGAGALLANVHAAWTHKVISAPADKKFQFFKRIPARSNWRNLALPAAVNASAVYMSMFLVHGYMMLIGLDKIHEEEFETYDGMAWTSLAMKGLSTFAIALSLALFIIVPARVTQTRVEASILPEDIDTIVPFDRSFAGKVVPKVLGGTGCVGFVDAWKSFNWEARRRLVKLYVKIYAIVTVMTIVLGLVFAFNVWALAGPEIKKAIEQAKREGF